MASHAGWYVGTILIGSPVNIKAGTGLDYVDTVFRWPNPKVAPTVPTANITGLAQITAGPYATEAEAKAKAASDKHATGGIPGTGTNPPVTVSTPGSGAGHLPNIPNPLTGLAAIGDFFHRLTEATTWIRVAKIIVGGALLIIGIAHMTGADNAVANAARRVPLPV